MRKLWIKVEKVVADWAILGMLLVALFSSLSSGSSEAHADYGFLDAFETIGISTGIGTVLGLSTLPFYDSPPLSNVYIGAGIGLLVGLGTSAYLWATSSDEIDEIGYDELIVPKEIKKEDDSKKKSNDSKTKSGKGAQLLPRGAFKRATYAKTRKAFKSQPHTLVSATLAQASSSLLYSKSDWAIAVKVLELRF